MHASTAPAVIRLRVAEFRDTAAKDGLRTDDDLAARFGVNRSTVYRLFNEQMLPGERFIAAALAAFPAARFEDFFEVVTPGTSRKAA